MRSLRERCSINASAYNRQPVIVSTRKSPRRRSPRPGRRRTRASSDRRGAEPGRRRPHARSPRLPTARSDAPAGPPTLRYPHRGFSCATRSTSLFNTVAAGGRPARRRPAVQSHFLAINLRHRHCEFPIRPVRRAKDAGSRDSGPGQSVAARAVELDVRSAGVRTGSTSLTACRRPARGRTDGAESPPHASGHPRVRGDRRFVLGEWLPRQGVLRRMRRRRRLQQMLGIPNLRGPQANDCAIPVSSDDLRGAGESRAAPRAGYARQGPEMCAPRPCPPTPGGPTLAAIPARVPR